MNIKWGLICLYLFTVVNFREEMNQFPSLAFNSEQLGIIFCNKQLIFRT